MRCGSSMCDGHSATADDERLADFFEKELPDEERDRLLSLPGDEMQRELQRLYLKGQNRREAGPVAAPGHRRRLASGRPQEEARQALAGGEARAVKLGPRVLHPSLPHGTMLATIFVRPPGVSACHFDSTCSTTAIAWPE